MIENQPTNVVAAFELLLEKLEAEVEFINKVGTTAFDARNYERAKEALERAGVLVAFRDKVVALRKEWDTITAREPEEDEEARAKRCNLGRLQRGMRTRKELYVHPILRALVEMGGAAQVNDVLDRVGQLMKGVLKPVDYEPLASNPEILRWRNAAQWARCTMIKRGLLKTGSPRGIWEITDAGRRALKQQPMPMQGDVNYDQQ